MNTLNKTAQAAKVTRAPILVRTGRALRYALFRTIHLTAWIAYFGWLLVPPVLWFSASPAHSHTATYWMAAIYLIAAGLMTWSGYIARAGFKVWQRDGDTWAGWWACGFSLPILIAPTLPLMGLIALLHNQTPTGGDGGQSARERDPTGWDPSYSYYSGNVSYVDRD